MVGCPLFRREWVLQRWFDHVEQAARNAEEEPLYVFVGDRSDPSIFLAIAECSARRRGLVLVQVTEDMGRSDHRKWDMERYQRMAWLRNQMLAAVRFTRPLWFLSLDSDILLHPDALVNLLESAQRFDAVGGKAYMTTQGLHAPSYGVFTNSGMRRPESEGVFPVDVIMAIKLMTPSAYAIDYEAEHRGEDIGWSKAARAAGLALGWDGRVTSKHVMAPFWLQKVDPRCGY